MQDLIFSYSYEYLRVIKYKIFLFYPIPDIRYPTVILIRKGIVYNKNLVFIYKIIRI